MELRTNMYVRTDMGDISKIKSIWENERVFFENKVDIDWFTSDSFGISYLKKCKASFNIIDLIEVGDYVNGYKVTDKFDYLLSFGNADWYMNEEDIKTIVTKEQFANIEYKLDDSHE